VQRREKKIVSESVARERRECSGKEKNSRTEGGRRREEEGGGKKLTKSLKSVRSASHTRGDLSSPEKRNRKTRKEGRREKNTYKVSEIGTECVARENKKKERGKQGRREERKKKNLQSL
jgi:hypothetical protein